ncbi:DUF1653 domain-containing protein [Patescibacteria group bacterium]|nr:DUF1653 domain-containing protein [Patescibacteria group bacterium]
MSDVTDIQEGARYQHYKGGMYTVVAVAKNATNAADGVSVVVYRAEKDGAVYVRNTDEFLEPVLWQDGITHPRFVPAEPQ